MQSLHAALAQCAYRELSFALIAAFISSRTLLSRAGPEAGGEVAAE